MIKNINYNHNILNLKIKKDLKFMIIWDTIWIMLNIIY
jgi:hypothetical protein